MTKIAIPRFLQKRFSKVSFPQIWIFKGKHDSVYYLLNNIEDVWKVSLAVVTMRLKDEYYQEPNDEPYGLQPELTPAAIDTLPEAYRNHALAVIRTNAKARDEHNSDVSWYAEVKRVVKEKDGVGAFLALEDRRGSEYEDYRFITPQIP